MVSSRSGPNGFSFAQSDRRPVFMKAEEDANLDAVTALEVLGQVRENRRRHTACTGGNRMDSTNLMSQLFPNGSQESASGTVPHRNSLGSLSPRTRQSRSPSIDAKSQPQLNQRRSVGSLNLGASTPKEATTPKEVFSAKGDRKEIVSPKECSSTRSLLKNLWGSKEKAADKGEVCKTTSPSAASNAPSTQQLEGGALFRRDNPRSQSMKQLIAGAAPACDRKTRLSAKLGMPRSSSCKGDEAEQAKTRGAPSSPKSPTTTVTSATSTLSEAPTSQPAQSSLAGIRQASARLAATPPMSPVVSAHVPSSGSSKVASESGVLGNSQEMSSKQQRFRQHQLQLQEQPQEQEQQQPQPFRKSGYVRRKNAPEPVVNGSPPVCIVVPRGAALAQETGNSKDGQLPNESSAEAKSARFLVALQEGESCPASPKSACSHSSAWPSNFSQSSARPSSDCGSRRKETMSYSEQKRAKKAARANDIGKTEAVGSQESLTCSSSAPASQDSLWSECATPRRVQTYMERKQARHRERRMNDPRWASSSSDPTSMDSRTTLLSNEEARPCAAFPPAPPRVQRSMDAFDQFIKASDHSSVAMEQHY